MTETRQARIGILGVGHLASYLAPRLIALTSSSRILLSPRGTATSQAIADKHGVEIARSNAELIERCDTILISVRPFQIEEALAGLPWRADHKVISLCAGVPCASIARHAGAAELVRAMPVSAGLFGESPTCMFPASDWAKPLLERFGPVIELGSEDQLEGASVVAAYYGWVQALIETIANRTSDAGLDADQARLLVSQMTRAAATVVRDTKDRRMDELVDELCLPGSITRHGLEKLRERDAFTPWEEAYDAVLDKLHGTQD